MKIYKNKRFQILALSGGGYRGLYSARVLELLEERFQKPIYKCFDLFAGTSIGGIIALGLALEKPASDICKTIEAHGSNIFQIDKGWGRHFRKPLRFIKRLFRPKHKNDGLKDAIKAVIGENTTLQDLKRPAIIPAVTLTAGSAQVFKTPHHEAHKNQCKIRLVDIALATAAAPTFFPVARIREADYVDGGLIANVPDLIALHEGETFMCKQRQHIFMVSVGTTSTLAAFAGGETLNRGLVNWINGNKLMEVTMAAQQALAQQLVEEMLHDRYLVINDVQSSKQGTVLKLDSASTQATATLKNMAEKSFEIACNDSRLHQYMNHDGTHGKWLE